LRDKNFWEMQLRHTRPDLLQKQQLPPPRVAYDEVGLPALLPQTVGMLGPCIGRQSVWFHSHGPRDAPSWWCKASASKSEPDAMDLCWGGGWLAVMQ